MAAKPEMNQEKLQAFAKQNLVDLAGTCATVLCIWGDRLGLFKHLAANGSATSQEMASRAGIHERYAMDA